MPGIDDRAVFYQTESERRGMSLREYLRERERKAEKHRVRGLDQTKRASQINKQEQSVYNTFKSFLSKIFDSTAVSNKGKAQLDHDKKQHTLSKSLIIAKPEEKKYPRSERLSAITPSEEPAIKRTSMKQKSKTTQKISTTLTSSGIANASMIAETLTTLKDKDQKHLSDTEYQQIVSGLSTLDQIFKDLSKLNELQGRDYVALAEMKIIDEDSILKTYYDSLRINLYQLFMSAIVISSGNIKVNAGFSALATKGMGIAITQGAIQVGATVIKGIPVASILGAAIESIASFAIERNKKIDLTKLAQMAQVRDSTPELLAQELARKITYGQQEIIRNPSKSGQGTAGFRKLKKEFHEFAVAVKKFVEEKAAGRQLNPIERLAGDTVVDLMAFAVSNEFKGLDTRQAVVDKALQLLNVQYISASVRVDEFVSPTKDHKHFSTLNRSHLLIPTLISSLEPASNQDLEGKIHKLQKQMEVNTEKLADQERELKQLRRQQTLKKPSSKDIPSGDGSELQTQLELPEEKDPTSSSKILSLEHELYEMRGMVLFACDVLTKIAPEYMEKDSSGKGDARSLLLTGKEVKSRNTESSTQSSLIGSNYGATSRVKAISQDTVALTTFSKDCNSARLPSPLVRQSLTSTQRLRAKTQQRTLSVNSNGPLIPRLGFSRM